MLDKEEKQKIRSILRNLRFRPFTFTLKIKHNSFKQESKVQAIAFKANLINYQDANNEIIKRLKIYNSEDKESTHDSSNGDKINWWMNNVKSTS